MVLHYLYPNIKAYCSFSILLSYILLHCVSQVTCLLPLVVPIIFVSPSAASHADDGKYAVPETLLLAILVNDVVAQAPASMRMNPRQSLQ